MSLHGQTPALVASQVSARHRQHVLEGWTGTSWTLQWSLGGTRAADVLAGIRITCVSKVQITCVSKCHLTSNFQYHKYLLATTNLLALFAESVGQITTSQAKQPLALKIVMNENIKDICSSCSDFNL